MKRRQDHHPPPIHGSQDLGKSSEKVAAYMGLQAHNKPQGY